TGGRYFLFWLALGNRWDFCSNPPRGSLIFSRVSGLVAEHRLNSACNGREKAKGPTMPALGAKPHPRDPPLLFLCHCGPRHSGCLSRFSERFAPAGANVGWVEYGETHRYRQIGESANRRDWVQIDLFHPSPVG